MFCTWLFTDLFELNACPVFSPVFFFFENKSISYTHFYLCTSSVIYKRSNARFFFSVCVCVEELSFFSSSSSSGHDFLVRRSTWKDRKFFTRYITWFISPAVRFIATRTKCLFFSCIQYGYNAFTFFLQILIFFFSPPPPFFSNSSPSFCLFSWLLF